MRKRSGQVHSRESSATLQLTVSLLYPKFVEYDDFGGDVWYNFKENSDIYKKYIEPIDERESHADDSIKEIIRKY